MNPYLSLHSRLHRPLFIPFTVLGDPDPRKSLKVVQTLIESGADALELGLPFSDPTADGPVIQAADVRALKAGTTVDDCFKIIRTIRTSSDIPIGLLVYFNLIFVRGIDRFYNDCKKSGVTSVLVADLPLEHVDEIAGAAKRHGIAPVFMVSERTTDDRLKAISKIAEGYLYVVSYTGITGVEDAISEERIRKTIRRARKYCSLPFFVGFGINTPTHVRAAAGAGADGVIVASRLVKEIPDLKRIGALCRELKQALLSPQPGHRAPGNRQLLPRPAARCRSCG
ncbi:MAG: tryptophan synthase subunit alpha [Candidatus Peribacteraceae bacterium]|nr:tryptophan synthase subunit alpha [Candidatus Peribacteraceae bacterium]